MNEEEEAAAKAAEEAGAEKAVGDSEDTSERLLKLLEAMDSRLGRLESVGSEKAVGDAEKDGESKPDFEEKKEPAETEEAFADSAIVKELKAKISQLERNAPRHRTNDEFDALAMAQNKAEAVYSAFGDTAAMARPMDGETVLGYRKRMVKGLQKHSATHGKIDVSAIADDQLLGIVENQVYADAMHAATAPTSEGLPNGMPRAVKGVDEVGRPFTHYVGGEPLAVFNAFRQQPRQVVGLRNLH
jgi:hypothetical protein